MFNSHQEPQPLIKSCDHTLPPTPKTIYQKEISQFWKRNDLDGSS
jgi:hypothetical protein